MSRLLWVASPQSDRDNEKGQGLGHHRAGVENHSRVKQDEESPRAGETVALQRGGAEERGKNHETQWHQKPGTPVQQLCWCQRQGLGRGVLAHPPLLCRDHRHRSGGRIADEVPGREDLRLGEVGRFIRNRDGGWILEDPQQHETADRHCQR